MTVMKRLRRCWQRRETAMIKKEITEMMSRIRRDLYDNRWGLLAVCLYFAFFLLLFQEVCPMLLLTGIPCPGCGLTRAGILLMRGHFAQAFQMHPFIYAWTMFFLYFVWQRYGRGRRMAHGMQIIIVLVVAMVLFYGYRMIHDFPHTEPMVWSEHSVLINIRDLYPLQ